MPLLKRIRADLERNPEVKCIKRVEPQLIAVRDVVLQCRNCIAQWTHERPSRIKVLVGMFCSKKYDNELVELNLGLASALNDLALQFMQQIPSASTEDVNLTETRAEAGAPKLRETHSDPPPSKLARLDSMGRYYFLCAAFADTAIPVQEEADDKQRDLCAFADWMATGGDWESLSAEDQQVIQEFYKATGLDFLQLLQGGNSQARSELLMRQVQALNFIRLEDITGSMGRDKLLEYVCMGGFGTVYKGMWQGEEVAVKKMEGVEAYTAKEELAREAYIMSTCRHPNIAEVYGLTTEPGTEVLMIVMKYYERGSLRDVLDDCEPSALTVAVKLRMARDVAQGMAYLHGRRNGKIIHGDLKPANLLVDQNMRIYITDFGVASMKTMTRTIAPNSNAQSVVYSAPELLERMRYNALNISTQKRTAAGDVYSFGMVLYELFTGGTPFNGANEGQVVGLVSNGIRPFIPPEINEHGIPGVPAPVAAIIEGCWAHNPADRPFFSQVSIAIEAAALALDVQLGS